MIPTDITFIAKLSIDVMNVSHSIRSTISLTHAVFGGGGRLYAHPTPQVFANVSKTPQVFTHLFRTWSDNFRLMSL